MGVIMLLNFSDKQGEQRMNTNLRKILTRTMAFAAIFTLLACLLPANWQAASAADRPSNPRISGGAVTWDCIEFGHYPQSSDGNGGYKTEPIKWRVLAVEGDEALLLADKNLDAQKYNETFRQTDFTNDDENLTWETSTIRSWLNGYEASSNKDAKDYTSDNFIEKAFTNTEEIAIKQGTVLNPNNPKYNTKGGNSTLDKVFLLSIEEAQNSAYGFQENNYNGEFVQSNETRWASTTDYAKSRGVVIEERTSVAYIGSGCWWLRSPGYLSSDALSCAWGGSITYEGNNVNSDGHAVRPALRLNLASKVWSSAGTVSSEDQNEDLGNSATIERITASKGKTAYKVNEALRVDDLRVTAFYSDGTSKTVTNYKTDAESINMKTAGKKVLTITYEENSVIRTTSIPITVTKSAVTITKPKKVTWKKVTSPKKGTLKLTWKRNVKATGYQAVIAKNSQFTKDVKKATIKNNKTTTKTFKKLKKKKTYYAKVRAYKQSGNKKVYGAYSKVKKVKVK